MATCSSVDLEILFSTRSPSDYDRVRAERRSFEQLLIEQVDWTLALDVQAELARRSQTRAVGIADLVLSAVAEHHRVELLHYDMDFELVAAVTGQSAEWVVPAGTMP